MSLVFLKNDDTMSQKTGRVQKPYRFSNYFTHPLKLPPNSQVALVNASFTLDQEVALDNDQPIYARFGQPVLNQGFKVELLEDKYIQDWTQFFNELGIEISQMNPDQNYVPQLIDPGVVQPPQNNVPPLNPLSRTQTKTPFGGLNWYLQNDKKSGLRVTQQADLVNDVFFQNFLPVRRPPGNTDLLLFVNGASYGNITQPHNAEAIGDTTGSDLVKQESSEEAFSHLALGNLAEFQNEPWVPRHLQGSIIRLGTAEARNGTLTDYTNQPIDNNYYNTQMAYDPSLENPTLQPGESMVTYKDLFRRPTQGVSRNYGWGVQANKCCIMRAVGDTTPDIANNGYGSGHRHIGNKGSGGYCVMGFEIRDAGEANSIYDFPIMGSSDLVGTTGFTPWFAGVLPTAVLYDRENSDGDVLNDDDSVYDFLKNVDLNIGDDENPFGELPNRETFDRNGAEARYLFGCKFGLVDHQGFKLGIQAQVLNPPEDGGSLDQSVYTNVGSMLNWTALAQGINTTTSPHTTFEPSWAINQNPGPRRINTVGGPRSGVHFYLRFRWDTPYTMVIEFTLSDETVPSSYDPVIDEPYLPWNDSLYGANGNANPLVGWCLLARMDKPRNSDGSAGAQDFRYLIPTSLGDITPVSYHTYTGAFSARKGYFSNQQAGFSREIASNNNLSLRGFRNRSFWKQSRAGFAKGMMGHGTLQIKDNDPLRTSPPLTLVDVTSLSDLEEFDSAGRIKKDFAMLGMATEEDEDLEEWVYSDGTKRFQLGEPENLQHSIAWGLQNNQNSVQATMVFNTDGDPNIPYKILTWDGINPYINSVEVISNHIQLTNLPIQSQQGVRNTQNKTIYNIPVFQGEDQKGLSANAVTNSYAFTPPQLIYIDLNNYQEMELNKLDVLITDDNNEEQKSLSHNTDMTLIFRQKGAGDAGYLPINIPTEEPEIRKRIKKETKKNLIEL